jgi:hypothetical protein
MHVRPIFWGRIVPLALSVIAAQSISMIGAGATSGTDYDSFDAVTLNDVGADGAEIPYTGGARDFTSAAFDSSAFNLDTGEAASSGGLHSCATPTGVSYAGRTGWVRFNPGVDGRVSVVAETPSHDSVLVIRSAVETPWRATPQMQLESPVACADRTPGAGDESVTDVPVTGDRIYFVQVGGKCTGAASTCQDVATPGGPTRIRLRFTPYDDDADGVPDARDNCEGQGTPGGVSADGCPDADHDGIADSADSCPRTAGVAAVAPYNGCPDGPRPPDPSNNPYVQIQSRSGDDYSTKSRKVVLRLNWPQGTTSAVIRNARSKERVRGVGDTVRWRLAKGRAGIRAVRVRFRGPGVSDVGVGDTIEYDPNAPAVAESLLIESAQGWYVGMKLTDRGTGIGSVTLLDEEQQPIEGEILCDGGCENEVDLALSTPFRRPAFIQVTDTSDNRTVTPLEKLASSERCPGGGTGVPRREPPSRWVCVVPRQLCADLRLKLRWRVPEDPEVRCRSVDRAPYRVVEL